MNPVMDTVEKKLVYTTTAAKFSPVVLRFPNNESVKEYATGLIMDCKHFVHDEYHATRTSLVNSVSLNDDGTVDVKTRNSIYRVVDSSITMSTYAHACIEALYEATFIKDTYLSLPTHVDLLKLFGTHTPYASFNKDIGLVSMLADLEKAMTIGVGDRATRLLYRITLRHYLHNCASLGLPTQCDISVNRTR